MANKTWYNEDAKNVGRFYLPNISAHLLRLTFLANRRQKQVGGYFVKGER